MKKLALSLIIASAAVFGVGTATSAQYGTTPTTPTTLATTTTSDAGSGAGLPSTTLPPTTLASTTVAATSPPAGLPATGSSGIGTTTGIAIGLFAVGLALFIVTRVRRNPDAA